VFLIKFSEHPSFYSAISELGLLGILTDFAVMSGSGLSDFRFVV
jgi:hypothetical protein